ncbi:FtsX-like permease family protein [Caenimonas koreensis]|uniref:FtsX-like permease family protein n=1 Tax=Caenimonas koreensis DSM 17982 TaxID=1121255 RepID=A0A844AR08_9BURK|nr:FtsX-like permease family protein [Caenimonas koreensis]MRD46464.1 FtsX-like permease family protein [Caenimonas koreensis DSM 17982]
MKTAALAFRYLWSRPLTALLNLLLLTLGLASITFVLLTSEQVDRSFQRDLAGIDLVVGAKGSPLQLILAGVFHIDVPPGNIALDEVRKLEKNPLVAQVIPLSLGDAFRGYRIVGTTPDYLRHYAMKLARGTEWAKPMEVVLGAQAAAATGMDVGAAFKGSHGLAGGQDHDDSTYRVSGVLSPCGCVVDRLVVTATESVWEVHETKHGAMQAPGKDHDADREVTIALVKYRSPMAAVSLPRLVNSTTRMQAASPAIEVTRLLRLLGVGSEVLRGVGAVLLLTAALSVFIALWGAVRERRADLAMLRMLGATPGKVAALLLCEAWWLALMASVLGLAAGHLLTAGAGYLLAQQNSLPVTGADWLPAEWWIPVAALFVATLAALVPAAVAYRVDVARLLNAR